MTALLAIYRAQFYVSLTNYLQYRFALLIWVFVRVFEPMVFIGVWGSVIQSSDGLTGLNSPDFSAYFIAFMVVNQMTFSRRIGIFENRLRSGSLTFLLLRPTSLIHRDLADALSVKAIVTPVVLFAAVAMTLLFQATFYTPLWAVAAFIPALILAFLLSFLVDYNVSLLAFWMTRTSAVDYIYFILVFFLSGRFAPLSLLPDPWQFVANLLPFRWILSFPTELLLGRLTVGETLTGFLAQGLWLLLSLGVLPIMWNAGVRRYTAVEGGDFAV
jgi:ABC-2 type transport system permease protein